LFRSDEGITGAVTLVEALGSETVVHSDAGGNKLIAVLQGQQPLKTGDTIALGYDPANLHAFDESGLRLA
jgi:multiple sugar transport system ATP-binding protein